MKKEEKVWWLALADQYEEWADDYPREYKPEGPEMHTCDALYVDRKSWGFLPISYERSVYPGDCLWPFWKPLFGDTNFPAGYVWHKHREAKRVEFCIEFAEYIRENVG